MNAESEKAEETSKNYINLFKKKTLYYQGAVIFFSLAMVLALVINQYFVYKKKYIHYNGPEFKKLYKWTLNATEKESVALTLDSDLLINLPVYSPLYMYIPPVLQTAIPTKERHKRLFETARFYGLKPKDMNSFFDGLIRYGIATRPGADAFKVRRGLMTLLLFMYMPTGKVTKGDKKKHVREYTQLLKGRKKILSFKADYWIVSKYDQQWIQEGSTADNIRKREKPVFESAIYTVYRLP